MSQAAPIWSSLEAFIASEQPDEPVFFLSPSAVTAGARAFLDGFPGFVTYAVKANPAPAVLLGLIAAGVRGFDVASPDEIAMLRRLCPEAALHYHNHSQPPPHSNPDPTPSQANPLPLFWLQNCTQGHSLYSLL